MNKASLKSVLHRHSFPKTHRLLDRKQFQAVIGKGQRSSDGLMTVIARSNDTTHSRLGITVSKRVSKRAVDRNRIKRWVREDFRKGCRAGKLLHLKGHDKGLDVVVIAKRAALTSDAVAISASIDRHWERILRKCNR